MMCKLKMDFCKIFFRINKKNARTKLPGRQNFLMDGEISPIEFLYIIFPFLLYPHLEKPQLWQIKQPSR